MGHRAKQNFPLPPGEVAEGHSLAGQHREPEPDFYKVPALLTDHKSQDPLQHILQHNPQHNPQHNLQHNLHHNPFFINFPVAGGKNKRTEMHRISQTKNICLIVLFVLRAYTS